MSATVPMEFSFGAGGSLKSAKRLRNLEFKRNRPTTHPSFANVANVSTSTNRNANNDTGSIIRNAYTGRAGGIGTGGRVGPLNQMPKFGPGIHGKNSIPIPIVADTMSGSEDSGGQLIPRTKPGLVNPVVPSLGTGTPETPSSSGGGSKKVIVIGGGLALLAAFVYFFVLDKGKKRKRRSKATSISKSRSRSRRR
jgi:hypothetical protein